MLTPLRPIPSTVRVPLCSLLLILGCAGGPELDLDDVFGRNGAGRNGADATSTGGSNGKGSGGDVNAAAAGGLPSNGGATNSSGSNSGGDGDGSSGAPSVSGGRGGATGSGGTLDTETGGAGTGLVGGSANSGGSAADGGSPTTGGKPGSGGSTSVGGALGTGGKAASGGTNSGTGGAPNTGGKAGTGGAVNTGGALNTGGKSTTGGSPNATGGTGGSEPIGGCDHQLLANGEFDQGPTPSWVETSSWPGVHIITSRSDTKLTAEAVTPFSGDYLAWLGGIPDNEYDHHTVMLTQKVTIPADAATLTLSGRRWVKTVENTSEVFDESYLEFEGADESVVWQALWLTNRDASAGWTAFEKSTSGLDALRGKTLTFVAYSRTDPGGKTSFFLDSLRLVATCGR